MSSPNSPLTDEHLQKLNRAIMGIPRTQQLAQHCANCGMDTQELHSKLGEMHSMALKLKQTFFPAAPKVDGEP